MLIVLKVESCLDCPFYDTEYQKCNLDGRKEADGTEIGPVYTSEKGFSKSCPFAEWPGIIEMQLENV